MPLPQWAEPVVIAIAPGLIKRLNATWDVSFEGARHLGVPGSPRLYAIWHGRQLALTAMITTLLSRGPAVVMTSASRDGRLQSNILTRLGLKTVTGSSSRHGERGLLKLARMVTEGHSVIIAVDGPSGPVFCAKSGICALSRLTRTPVVPVGVRAHTNTWTVPDTWDHYLVPRPRARLTVRLGPPVPPPAPGLAELKLALDRLQRRMAALNSTTPTSLRRRSQP